MSAPVSLGSMVTSVTQRANLENRVVVGGFISPSELRGYINEGLQELWEKLVAARGAEHMRKTYSFNTVQGTSAYTLPADFFELISVDINVAPGSTTNPQYINAKMYTEDERNMFRFYPGLVGWYWGQPVFYRIQGSPQLAGATVSPKLINFIPLPQGAYPVGLNYYPQFAPFATDGSQDSYVFDGVSGWEGFAIYYAVCLCKAKLKEDYTFASNQVERFTERLNDLADQNDAGSAERIRDVSNESFEWYGWGMP